MLKTYEGVEYDINEALSFKDFSGRGKPHFPSVKGVIYGSCFSQETPDNHIFPEDMEGVTFIKCNLDNVYIPPKNTVIDCWQRRFKVQNDRNDWLIDVNDLPVKPVQFKIFEKLALPLPEPKDIPLAMLSEDDAIVDLVKFAEIKKAFLAEVI